jgi:hypothetical protein
MNVDVGVLRIQQEEISEMFSISKGVDVGLLFICT